MGFATQDPESKHCLEPMEERPVPDMTDAEKPCNWRRRLDALEPGKETPSSERHKLAYSMYEKIAITYMIVHKNGGGEMERFPMSELVRWCVKDCVLLINAVILTDFHLGIPMAIVEYMPYPTCAFSITKLNDILSNKVQLTGVGANEFVVLLAAAARLLGLGKPKIALQICHELRAHAEGTYSCLDWDDLHHSASPLITEDDLRFALASVGIQAACTFYRSGLDPQTKERFGMDTFRLLLNSVEEFSKDQVKVRPMSAAAYYNLGWVEKESVQHWGVDPLAGYANCFHMMVKCFMTADAQSDDYFSATGRIMAARCLTLGAGGIVGFDDGNVVERDFRTEKHKALSFDTSNLRYIEIVNKADTRKIGMALVRKDKKRVADGIPATMLAPGEILLIAPWHVLTLWNEAMKYFDREAGWGCGHAVYLGTGCCWDAVVSFLKGSRYLDLGEYVPGPVDPGDIGEGNSHNLRTNCGWCGRLGSHSKNRKCSRCNKVFYCDGGCQKLHWKQQGGHKSKCNKA